MSWKRNLVSFASGLVFALGLGISGMTDPGKVLGFLDVAGSWDPSLAFVMAAAMLPNIVLFRWILRRPRPWLADRFHLPTQTRITGRLVVGSALFGVGWGIAGYCPGPALVSTVQGGSGVLAFTAAMVLGSLAYRSLARLALSRTELNPVDTNPEPAAAE